MISYVGRRKKTFKGSRTNGVEVVVRREDENGNVTYVSDIMNSKPEDGFVNVGNVLILIVDGVANANAMAARMEDQAEGQAE